MKFGGHKDEGYAIDWSPVVPGRLVSGMLSMYRAIRSSQLYFFLVIASFREALNVLIHGFVFLGDCKHCIHLWEPSSETWIVDKNPFVGHTASVEDLQVCVIPEK